MKGGFLHDNDDTYIYSIGPFRLTVALGLKTVSCCRFAARILPELCLWNERSSLAVGRARKANRSVNSPLNAETGDMYESHNYLNKSRVHSGLTNPDRHKAGKQLAALPYAYARDLPFVEFLRALGSQSGVSV